MRENSFHLELSAQQLKVDNRTKIFSDIQGLESFTCSQELLQDVFYQNKDSNMY